MSKGRQHVESPKECNIDLIIKSISPTSRNNKVIGVGGTGPIQLSATEVAGKLILNNNDIEWDQT